LADYFFLAEISKSPELLQGKANRERADKRQASRKNYGPLEKAVESEEKNQIRPAG